MPAPTVVPATRAEAPSTLPGVCLNRSSAYSREEKSRPGGSSSSNSILAAYRTAEVREADSSTGMRLSVDSSAPLTLCRVEAWLVRYVFWAWVEAFAVLLGGCARLLKSLVVHLACPAEIVLV